MTAHMTANILQDGRQLFHRYALPNSEGFRFLAYDMDHNKYRCEVVKVDGCHRVEGCEFSKIIGWTNEGERDVTNN